MKNMRNSFFFENKGNKANYSLSYLNMLQYSSYTSSLAIQPLTLVSQPLTLDIFLSPIDQSFKILHITNVFIFVSLLYGQIGSPVKSSYKLSPCKMLSIYWLKIKARQQHTYCVVFYALQAARTIVISLMRNRKAIKEIV